MKYYLYCFFDKDDGAFYTSGIEFKDLAEKLCEGNPLALLKHEFGDACYDPQTRLEYILPDDLDLLAKDDIYQYGDFAFFTCEDFAALAQPGILASILYFAHMGHFENGKPPLKDSVFYWGHDDGWFTKIYADHSLLRAIILELGYAHFSHFDANRLDATLQSGKALWIDSNSIKVIAANKDMDQVIAENSQH